MSEIQPHDPHPAGPKPKIYRIRWVLGVVSVVLFYTALFLGVYLDLSPNQTALLATVIVGIPLLALWLTFVLGKKK